MKTFILLSGLPASGKDSAGEFFQKKGFYSISFSSKILKPIIEDTKNSLSHFIQETIGDINDIEIERAIEEIEKIKREQKGRELYITIGAIYLKDLIGRLTNGEYNHFLLFSTLFFEKENKVIIASFRMIEELEVLKKKYSDSKIIKVLIKTDDKIRYERIKSRDGLDEKEIVENEKYERETTYEKLISEIEFDYTIENNSTKEDFEKKLEEIYLKV